MDTKKLPLSMLVALGLAPGCDDIGCMTKPCLDIAEPPEKKEEKKADPKQDPDMHPCLSPPPDPSGVHPCLEVPPCLSPPPQDPKTAPCLDVQACLSPPPDPPPETPTPKKSGGMARSDVLDRVENVLPPDVAARLRGRA